MAEVIIATIFSGLTANAANSQRKKAIRRNEAQAKIEGQEAKRRRDLKAKRDIAREKAKAASGGVSGATVAAFLGDFEGETLKQNEFADQINSLSISNQTANASGAANAANLGAFANIFSTAAQGAADHGLFDKKDSKDG